MKILRQIPRKKPITKNAIVTVGVFDGMHQGHRRVIQDVVRRARSAKVRSVVLTFSPHPVHVLRPESYCPLIVSLAYRLKLIADLGVDLCLVIPFRKQFAQMPPENFVHRYLVDLFQPAAVVVGDDFRFGQDRNGTMEMFQAAARKSGFDLVAISTGHRGSKRYSSTKIREHILRGELKQAARLLGRPVSMLGRVVHGDSRGRKLGFPTANINPANELLPPSGIYLVNVHFGSRIYHGLANVGRRPSFKKIRAVNVEAYLLNFHQDLYGQEILIEFLKKIRDEELFPSAAALVEQMRRDKDIAQRWFSKNKFFS